MTLQATLFSKVVQSNGTIGLSIAVAVVVVLVFVLLLYVNRRLFCAHSNRSQDKYTLPEINRQSSINAHSLNVKQHWDQLQVAQLSENLFVEPLLFRSNVHSHIKNERELEQKSEKAKFLIRNRGSCSSSSDSTTGAYEEETSAVRQREKARYGRTFSMQEEPLGVPREDLDDQFSDIHSAFSDSVSGIIGKCGLLEVAFAYDAPVKNMTIHVLQARDVPATDRSRPPNTQVHIVLLPRKKQKQKSKIRLGNNPQFMESFLFNRVTPEDVNNMSVRFRLYGCERMRRQRLIGECIVSFSNINLQLQSNIWVPLEPKAKSAINMVACEVLNLCQSDSTSGSVQSMQHGGVPELLLGLSYNGTTGRLSVEVIKGSNFRHVAAYKAPHTYVKLVLVSSTGQKLACSKTSIRRSQPNPLFKELFMYQVALFQICDVTLMINVYNKKSIKRKERIGWFTLGRTCSGEEELVHWEEMIHHKVDQLAKWHILIES